MESRGSILLVEDDFNLGKVTQKRLEEVGFEVFHASDGNIGWLQFQKHHFDICLLDIVLPKRNGYELAKLIRSKSEVVPIIFLTAKAEDEDKIRGFRNGCDDYIVKPFSMQELILRIDVWLRRSQSLNADKKNVFTVGRIVFNYGELKLTDIKGKLIAIVTQKEADLIKFLLLNINKTLKREEILYHVWGKDDYFLGRSMDVFMTKVRKLFESEKGIELITLHGVGFKFQVNI